MSEVIVKFNNQNYHLACKDGEGERLTRLAEYVDNKAAQILRNMGAVTDIRLLLMTAILIADELDEARNGKAPESSSAADRTDQFQDTLIHTIKRLEEITREVEAEG